MCTHIHNWDANGFIFKMRDYWFISAYVNNSPSPLCHSSSTLLQVLEESSRWVMASIEPEIMKTLLLNFKCLSSRSVKLSFSLIKSHFRNESINICFITHLAKLPLRKFVRVVEKKTCQEIARACRCAFSWLSSTGLRYCHGTDPNKKKNKPKVDFSFVSILWKFKDVNSFALF